MQGKQYKMPGVGVVRVNSRNEVEVLVFQGKNLQYLTGGMAEDTSIAIERGKETLREWERRGRPSVWLDRISKPQD